MFPLEKLLLSILQDARASLEVVKSVSFYLLIIAQKIKLCIIANISYENCSKFQILPATKQLITEEIALRKRITSLGVKFVGKISTDSESDAGTKNSSKKKKAAREEEIEQCYNCNYTLYLSMVRPSHMYVVIQYLYLLGIRIISSFCWYEGTQFQD